MSAAAERVELPVRLRLAEQLMRHAIMSAQGTRATIHVTRAKELQKTLEEALDRLTLPAEPTSEQLREAIETQRRQWFCSGSDCEAYDHGRDEGFDLALKAFDEAITAHRLAMLERGRG